MIRAWLFSFVIQQQHANWADWHWTRATIQERQQGSTDHGSLVKNVYPPKKKETVDIFNVPHFRQLFFPNMFLKNKIKTRFDRHIVRVSLNSFT